MRKTLQLVLAIALFLCGFGLNAQRADLNRNTLTSFEQRDVKKNPKDIKAPEFRTEQFRGAEVTMIIDEYHFPYDISDNGKHVAMQGFGNYPSYYWSEETGVIPMNNGYAFAVSDDGMVAGYFLDGSVGGFGANFAGLWSPETEEWTSLGMNPDVAGFADTEYNGAWAMTNDGSILAIMQYNESWDTFTYLWTEADGYTKLPQGTAMGSRPNAINLDGSVVAGRGVNSNGFWFACYWVDGEYYDFGEELFGEAMAVSPDGNYIAGYANDRIFVYNRELDELTMVEDSNFENTYNATCVTNDGVVFGYVVDTFPPFADARRAVVYIDGELLTFNDYMLMKGVTEAAEWTFYSVNSITSDGTTFTGAANIEGYDYTFIMTVEEPACQGPKSLTYNIDEMNNYDDVVLSWIAPENAEGVTYEIYDSYTSETPLVTGITETTYTFVDLEPGVYSYIVKANWGDCLSPGSNIVRPIVGTCSAADQCEVSVDAYDSYGDGWNGAYIEIVGEESGLKYNVELKDGSSEIITLSLCPDVYTFNWVAGPYDEEISFSIYANDELLYDSTPIGIPEAGTILKHELNCVNEEIVELDPFIKIADEYAFPYDISNNKKHVAIQTFTESSSYYWSEATGLLPIQGYAYSVSDDGMVAGTFMDPATYINHAGLWNPSTQEWTAIENLPDNELPEGLPTAPADYTSAWSMTNDGNTIAVMYTDPTWNTESYLYSEADGYTQLEAPSSTRPNAISNDGRVVAGHGVADLGWTICYWVDGEYHEIPHVFGEALSVSNSGRYVGGYADSGLGFVIDTETDEVEYITSDKMVGSYTATCVNDKGDAFGFYSESYMPASRQAFAYVNGYVMPFNDYLEMCGYVGAEDYMFYSVNAVTADGRTFLCAATVDGDDCCAIITVPEAECQAPTNLTYSISEDKYNSVILSWTAPENADNVTYEIYDDLTAESAIVEGITETTCTLEDLNPGVHNFMVRAFNGDCLSMPSNSVRPTVYPCDSDDMCEITFVMTDEYADGWNEGYLEVTGTKSDLVYTVVMDYGKPQDTKTLSLCSDTYTFTWVSGIWDEEIAFAILNGEDELYSVKFADLEDMIIGTFLEYNLDCTVGVGEIVEHNGINVMPNPAKDYFNIEGMMMTTVEVYNTVGQMIDVVNVNNDNIQISTAKYEEGVYFVKINTTDANTVVKKVVITK